MRRGGSLHEGLGSAVHRTSAQRSCVTLPRYHKQQSSHFASLQSGPQPRACACRGFSVGCRRSRSMCSRPLTRLSSGAAVLALRRRLATAAAAQATAQPTAHAAPSESAFAPSTAARNPRYAAANAVPISLPHTCLQAHAAGDMRSLAVGWRGSPQRATCCALPRQRRPFSWTCSILLVSSLANCNHTV